MEKVRFGRASKGFHSGLPLKIVYPCLTQYVANAFEAGGDSFKIRRWPQFVNFPQAFFDIDKVVPACREHCIYLVVRQASVRIWRDQIDVFEVVSDSIQQEFFEF